MTKDEFARFMAIRILTIETYNFDVLYDIQTVIDDLKLIQGKTGQPMFTTYHLMTRDTGGDMVKPDDQNYALYKERNYKIWELEFCFNRDYFNLPFCIVSQIK